MGQVEGSRDRLLPVAGLAFGAWVAHEARTARFFSLRPFIRYVLIALGLWMIIEASEPPARRLTRPGQVFSNVGMAIGLVFTWYVMGRWPFTR